MKRRKLGKGNDSDLVLVVSATDIVSIVHWHDAIGAVLMDKAVTLESNGKTINSQHLALPWPEVILQKRSLPAKLLRPPLCRRTIFERDNYTCQYCRAQPEEKKLQVEHVIPKYLKGPHTFKNCVTSCGPCNNKKRNRTPEQAGMKLIRQPQDLEPVTLAARMKMKAKRKIRPSWQKYIDAYS